jgi:hypothetical protein
MCPNVMNFVRIKKIQLNRVGEDCKLNPSIFSFLNDSKMEIPTFESLVKFFLGSFQNYKFLEDCTKIPYFIDR